MSDRYVVNRGKTIIAPDGLTRFPEYTIVKRGDIANPRTGKVDPGLIREGYISELKPRPEEQIAREIAEGQAAHARAQAALSAVQPPPTPAAAVIPPGAAFTQEQLDSLDPDELRALANEWLGQGRDEFQPDDADAVASVKAELLEVRTSGSSPNISAADAITSAESAVSGLPSPNA